MKPIHDIRNFKLFLGKKLRQQKIVFLTVSSHAYVSLEELTQKILFLFAQESHTAPFLTLLPGT